MHEKLRVFLVSFSVLAFISFFVFELQRVAHHQAIIPGNPKLEREADLVFEGRPTRAETLRTGKVHASERAPEQYRDLAALVHDQPWAVTFSIDRMVKGSFTGNQYTVLLHSPARSFGLNSSGDGVVNSAHYRLYVKRHDGNLSQLFATEKIE